MNKKYFKMSYVALVVASGLANASPIIGIDDAYFTGADEYFVVDPRTACDIFNQNVSYINNALGGIDDTAHIDNLCRTVRINDGQIENSYQLTTVNGAYAHGSNKYKVTEQIDVARTIDILMFSQSDKTDYVLIVNGSADVSKQTLAYGGSVEWTNENVLPFFWYREGYLGQVFHGNSQFNYMSGEAEYNVATKRAESESNNEDEIERLKWKYLTETCENGKINEYCIPEGYKFGKQFINTQTYPSSTNADGKQVDIANSTTFGFDISGSFEASKSDGPSAGLNVGFSFHKTKEGSQTHNVMTLISVGQGNDVGTKVTQKINTLALGEAAQNYQSSGDGWNRVVNAGSIWGEDLYRSYPLDSYEAWQENYTSDRDSCTSQEIIFGNSLTIARTHLNMYGGSWKIQDEDIKTVDANYGIAINTKCTVDDKGQTFRVMQDTLL